MIASPKQTLGVLLSFCVSGVLCACHEMARPASASATQSASAPTPPRVDAHSRATSTILDEKVDIGDGLKLHIRCEGEGAPTAVFDSGLGQGAEAWTLIQPAVAKFTRSCAYDRASRGSSDPAKRPHSNAQMARELHALLTKAAETGPFVLVGHSMGGTNVQLFLAQHPAAVAGMVLIDSSPEPPPFADIPPAALADFEKNIATLEGLDMPTFLTGFKDLQAANRSLGSKPLAILIAGRALQDPNLSDEKSQAALTARQRAQQPLADLSSNRVVMVVPDSAHHIPGEKPQVVVGAVRAVTQAVRDGSQLSEAALTNAIQPL